MSNDTPESGQEQAGVTTPVVPATPPPTPSISSASGAQPPSTPVDDEALVERLLNHPKLQTAIERKAQSLKDRRLQQQEDRLSGVERVLQYLPNVKPEDVQQAQRAMALDDLVAGRYSPQPDPGRSEEVDANQLWANAKKILSKAGIPENDPEVIALAGKNYQTEGDYYADIAGIAAGRVKPQVPAGAIVNDGSSGSTPVTADKEARMDQINRRMAEISKNPTAYREELSKLTTELSSLVKR